MGSREEVRGEEWREGREFVLCPRKEKEKSAPMRRSDGQVDRCVRYLDDGREVVAAVDVGDLEPDDVGLALRARVPDHVTLEVVALLGRQLYKPDRQHVRRGTRRLETQTCPRAGLG